MSTTLTSFHKNLVVSLFDRTINDMDAFLVFHILHDFELHVSPGVLKDSEVAIVPAVTQRMAASCLAALWRGAKDERSHYEYWYWRWNTEWGANGHSENLSVAENTRLEELIAKFLAHDWITNVVED